MYVYNMLLFYIQTAFVLAKYLNVSMKIMKNPYVWSSNKKNQNNKKAIQY